MQQQNRMFHPETTKTSENTAIRSNQHPRLSSEINTATCSLLLPTLGSITGLGLQKKDPNCSARGHYQQNMMKIENPTAMN